MRRSLHTTTFALPYADVVTSVVASLLPDREYAPHSETSGGDRPHEVETTLPGHIHDHVVQYRLQWPPVRSGALVYDSAPSRGRRSKRYCQYRQSGVRPGLSLPALLSRLPVQWFLQGEASLLVM